MRDIAAPAALRARARHRHPAAPARAPVCVARPAMEARVRALDRVMRARQIWVPRGTKASCGVAYWDVFGRPEKPPLYARGDSTWWFDQAKYDRLTAEGALR